MAVLSLNEIKLRAQQFVLNWKDKAASSREEADAQTFENEFFAIFGVPRSKIAGFEQKVKLQDGSNGYIYLFGKDRQIFHKSLYCKECQYRLGRRRFQTLRCFGHILTMFYTAFAV